jgi:hypothetical protein
MSENQNKENSLALTWVLGIAQALSIACLTWVGSTLLYILQVSTRLETKLESQEQQIKELAGKAETAYYTSLESQKKLDKLEASVSKK